MKTFRHILVPVDHEPHSRAALEYAVTIATRFDAEVAIVHGHQGNAWDGLDGESIVVLVTRDRVPALAEKLRMLDGVDLHPLLGDLEDIGRPQPGVVIDPDDPTHAILGAAHGADLVVIGSHGRTGAARLVRGSIAEDVARRAPCPVLIVHAG